EDGIRDFHVTGVQTCALPILSSDGRRLHGQLVRHADVAHELPVKTTPVAAYLDHALILGALREVGADAVWPGWGFVAESPEFVRSEERPVGDECSRCGVVQQV